MTFSDILKQSFLDGYDSLNINIYTAAMAIIIACAIGIYIFVVYRVITRKTFYSKTFNISLVAIAMITAAVIITIQSSIVVSLGMVGALSIVRFRTAIKDPMDLVFLFWSIVTGIICGVGLAEIAVLLSIAITVTIMVLNRLPVAKVPMMLVVNASDHDVEKNILEVVSKYAKHNTVKSRNLTKDSLNLIIELRTSDGLKLVKDVLKLDGISSASLLSHDGEVTF
ncbi:MAG: DUF4956 domain-containing protein [Lachnospiraceae bacterium]|nr:DUF4956 domain-containing protein [Lachnospiraceae bacterium]